MTAIKEKIWLFIQNLQETLRDVGDRELLVKNLQVPLFQKAEKQMQL